MINTLIGIIVAIPLLILGKYKGKFCGQFVFAIGKEWGGFSIGLTMVVSNDCFGDEKIMQHEFGHSIQACIMGPLFIFLVAIPSTFRYWYRVLHLTKLHSAYDDIWFEHEATYLGTQEYTKWGSKNG